MHCNVGPWSAASEYVGEVERDGLFEAVLTAEAGHDYTLEISTDLITWAQATNVSNTSGATPIIHVGNSNATARFFRILK